MSQSQIRPAKFEVHNVGFTLSLHRFSMTCRNCSSVQLSPDERTMTVTWDTGEISTFTKSPDEMKIFLNGSVYATVTKVSGRVPPVGTAESVSI